MKVTEIKIMPLLRKFKSKKNIIRAKIESINPNLFLVDIRINETWPLTNKTAEKKTTALINKMEALILKETAKWK